MRKSQEQYPLENKILHNFHNFFSSMDIKHFGNGRESAVVMLSVQKNEKTTRTVSILKSNSAQFSLIFFFSMDIKIFLKEGAKGAGRGWDDFFLHISSM